MKANQSNGEPSGHSQITSLPAESRLGLIWSQSLVILGLAGFCLLSGWAVQTLVIGHDPVLSCAALFLLVIVVSAVPSIMEDVGCYLVHNRMYQLGKLMLLFAHRIDQIFLWQRGQTHSMNAMRLAQLALLLNNLDEALKWGTRAIEMSEKDAWFGKFYANCVVGQIHCASGNWHQARSKLQTADELFRTGIQGTPLAILRDKLRGFATVNLDLLGRVMVLEGETAAARAIFDRSYTLRSQLPGRAPLAEAIREHSFGLIAFQEFDVEQATQRFSRALQLLPTSIPLHITGSWGGDQTLAIEVCTDAVAYGKNSEAVALQACDKLGSLHSQGLPPRLISLAAKPVRLLRDQP